MGLTIAVGMGLTIAIALTIAIGMGLAIAIALTIAIGASQTRGSATRPGDPTRA